MKRLFTLALALVLTASFLAGCKGDPQFSGTLIVGSGALTGDFLPGFGANTFDGWVKTILHEHYSTYVVTETGETILNTTVVKDKDVSTDAAGNRTYTFEVHDDLKWNNGETITAKDFVFSVLWSAAKEWADVGAVSTMGDRFLGFKDYHEGAADRFAGVQLLDEFRFSLTIDASHTPYFFETTYLTIYPLYMAGWAPASDIGSNSQGAKIIINDELATLDNYALRVAQIQRYAPTVTSGPFTFVGFDNKAVTLKANPQFKGDYKGQKPQLEHIIIRAISQSADVDLCIEGEVYAVTGIVEGAKIDSAKANDAVKTSYYPRNGFGGLFFHCDFGPAQHSEVRQAMAYLVNREVIINETLGGHGTAVNGLYSPAQWMYLENKGTIDALPDFSVNLNKANELLDDSLYKFESDGETPFDVIKATAGANYYRHNKSGEKLTINHLETEDGGRSASPLAEQLEANAPMAGIDFRVTRTDWNTILVHWYEGHLMPRDQRKYHCFELATGIPADHDPYLHHHSDMLDVPLYNNWRISDPELDEIVVEMRRLDPELRDEFSAEWVEFQKRWNELLPALPLYANHYYDICRNEVHGFMNTPFVSWADLVCQINMQ